MGFSRPDRQEQGIEGLPVTSLNLFLNCLLKPIQPPCPQINIELHPKRTQQCDKKSGQTFAKSSRRCLGA
jgi:hypothetical protein